MSDIKLEQYLVDRDFALREIPNELNKKGYIVDKYFEEVGICKIIFNKEFKSMKEIFKKNSYTFDKDRYLWHVYLSKNATDNFYREVILNEDWNTNYRYGHNNEVHRGHCLANKFKDYLVPKQYLNEKKVSEFFGRGNICNVYPQSANSNCSNGMKGQLTFEGRVWNFLEESESHQVFYEIENFIVENKKSLGRRIKGIFANDGKFVEKTKEDEELHFHVFIPNIYDGNFNISEPKVENE